MRNLKNGEAEIVLDPQLGFIERTVTERFRGTADAILQKLATETVITIKGIAAVGGVLLSAASKGGNYSVWGSIPSIWLNTKWRAIEDGKVLTPEFWRPDGSRILLKLEWKIPENMTLWFLSMFDKPNGTYRHQNSYLIASSTAAAGWFLPPVTNLFDDGRICMGDTPVAGAPSLAEAWHKATVHYANSQFNSHLATRLTQENVAALISYDAADNKQRPVPANWHTKCNRVNSTIYNCITQ